MPLVRLNFESEYLRSNHEVSIVLPVRDRLLSPREFYGSDRKYKVLWLLHGTYGDHSDWVRRTNIERYANQRDLIVVMPSGLNSDFDNWPLFSIGYNMWDYLFEELMPLVQNWFPASTERCDNYVAGLSMGGSGALKMALGHPELFEAAAILSSAPRHLRQSAELKRIASIEAENPLELYHLARNPQAEGPITNYRMLNAVLNAGSVEAYLGSRANTWDRLNELAPSGTLPRLYFACGTDDFLYDTFKAFRAHAEETNLSATFEEGPGEHNWQFWDTYIQKALDFFGI